MDGMTRETNDKFARNNQEFQSACAKANVGATSRQASKWRRGVGAAAKLAGREPIATSRVKKPPSNEWLHTRHHKFGVWLRTAEENRRKKSAQK